MRGRRSPAFSLLATLTMTTLGCGPAGRVQSAGFSFDQVTFELSLGEMSRLGGPIVPHERETIQATASTELRTAYSGLRLSFVDRGRAFYRVFVVQDLPPQRLNAPANRYMFAAESRTLGPFGGRSTVSFAILARNAIHHAPPGAGRAAIIEGIGKGIGRAAAHELAHQILPGVDLHRGRDRESYEYGNADRPAQYYGALHWSTARPALVKKLGTV